MLLIQIAWYVVSAPIWLYDCARLSLICSLCLSLSLSLSLHCCYIVYIIKQGEVQRTIASLMREEALDGSTFLVIANKMDRDDALSLAELEQRLRLASSIRNTHKVFGVSALNGQGVDEAFQWLTQHMPET
jgi:GTPase Era involved in 16S rRNA processing